MTAVNSWEPEEQNEEVVQPQAPIHGSVYDLPSMPTTSIVLVGSNEETFGEIRIVQDYHPTGFKEGDLIGYWDRVKYDGLIHGQLTVPLDAIKDRGTQVRSLLAKQNKQKRAGKAPEVEDKGKVTVEFNYLREKLLGHR